MTATGHALVGVAFAALIPNPLIGIPVAVLSHIPCDLFPHWDSGTAEIKGRKKPKKQFINEAIIDVTLSFILTILITITFFPNLNVMYALLMAISAQGFDYISIPYVVFNWKYWPFSMVFTWQKAWNITLDAPWGIINQFALCILLLVAVYRF